MRIFMVCLSLVFLVRYAWSQENKPSLKKENSVLVFPKSEIISSIPLQPYLYALPSEEAELLPLLADSLQEKFTLLNPIEQDLTMSSFWLKCDLQNERGYALPLDLQFYSLEKVEVYLLPESYSSASLPKPLADVYYKTDNTLIPIVIPTGKSSLYFHVSRTQHIYLSRLLYGLHSFELKSKDENFFWRDHDRGVKYTALIILGGLILMFFYHLVLFLMIFERNYLYYLLCLFFAGAFIFVERDFYTEWVAPSPPHLIFWLIYTMPVFFTISQLAFAANYLELRKRFIPGYFFIGGLIGLLSFDLLIILPFFPLVYFQWMVTCIMFSNLGILGVTLLLVRRNYVKPLFYLSGNVSLNIGIIIYALAEGGYLGINMYTLNAAFLGILIEMSLFSLGLAYKLKESSQELEAEKAKQLKEKERIIEEKNLELRRRVRDRTRELRLALSEVERQKANVELSEEKYRKIIETSLEGIFVIDETNTVLFVNDNITEIIGYKTSEIVGRSLEQFLFNIDSPTSEVAMAKLKIGEPIQYDLALKSKNNELKWVVLKSNPDFSAEGKYQGAILMITDITDRKKIEEENIKSKNLLDEAQRLAQLGSWEWDIERNTILWSEEQYRLFGEDPKTFTPKYKDIFSHFSARDAERIQKILKRTIETSRDYSLEYEIKRKDGKSIHVFEQINVVLDENNKPYKIVGTTQDISERKKLERLLVKKEASLKEKNILLQAILESPKGMIIFSLDTKYRYKAFTDSHKQTMKNIFGVDIKKGMNMLEAITQEEDREKAKINFDRALAGEQLLFIEDYGDQKLNRASWENRYAPIYDTEGNITGLTVFVTDITERRRIELELKKSYELVKEQNKRLMNFSHIVSHNLRSHTSNIAGILEIWNDLDSEEEKNKMIGLLNRVSQSLNETIYDLNDVVSVQTNTELKREYLKLNDYIDRALLVLKDQIELKDAIIYNHVGDDVKVYFNSAYLDSVVLNFISNAIKYSYPGRQPMIILESGYENDRLYFRISDNGIGIDLKKYGNKLFGMYKTFHNNKEARGIGLFITKNQIEAMGGEVKVESTPYRGTSFKIYFM